MLEKIGQPGYETLSRADPVVVRLAGEVAEVSDGPVYYEIGVGVGATALEVARVLDNRGRILLFSRANDVAALAADLANLGFGNVDPRWGSPGNTYSGYHFELARGFADRQLPAFHLAYIDGGHVFHLDAPAALILKELCLPGGYIVFDDWNWSLARSPTLNPVVRPQTARDYEPAQIETAHVRLVCQVVMDTDGRFDFLGLTGNTAVYRRRLYPQSPGD